jgi:hypothetical protein
MSCGRAGKLLLTFQLTVPSGSGAAASLGPRPRSRLTDQQRISDDEEAVLFEAICDDIESNGFSFSLSASDDVRGQQRMCEMSNRELIGVILTSKDIDDLVRA